MELSAVQSYTPTIYDEAELFGLEWARRSSAVDP